MHAEQDELPVDHGILYYLRVEGTRNRHRFELGNDH